jgi:hypothetical protein
MKERPDNCSTRRIVGVIALAISAVVQALAAEPSLVLDEIADTNVKEVTYIVPASGEIPLTFVVRDWGSALTNIQVSLPSLRGDQGDLVTVRVAPENLSISQGQKAVSVKLLASAESFSNTGKYTGTMRINTQAAEVGTVKLAVRRGLTPRSGALALDQTAVAVAVTRSWWRPWCGGDTGGFSVTLREKSGNWPLYGIGLRMEQAAKPGGNRLDLERNAMFWFNGKPETNMTTSPADPKERSIEPGKEATLRMQLRGLKPGEYTAVLRFTASNSTDDDAAQRLTLMVQVRDPIWGAGVVMIVALTVSFFASKGLNLRKQRLALLKRISDTRPSWLRTEPQRLPVVWTRAMFAQAEQLTRATWLSSADAVEQKVASAAKMTSALSKMRDVREEFARARAQIQSLVYARAMTLLDGIMARLGDSPPDEAAMQQLQADLAALRGWLQPGQLEASYWKSLAGDIAALLPQVTPETMSDPRVEAQLSRLKMELMQPAPVPLVDMVNREESYARLKVLWERRKSPEFGVLLAEEAKKGDLASFFRAADDAAWERLKTAQKEQKVSVEALQDEDIVTFQPLHFVFRTGDPALDQTFLVEHGLRYEWTVTIEPDEPWYRRLWRKLIRRKQEGPWKKRILSPVTDGPRLVQYSPSPGQMRVNVRVRCENEILSAGQKAMKTLSLFPSTDFRWQEGFEGIELASLAISAVFALLTGLATYYLKNPTFGSAQDYVSLFLWGVSVDQAKNVLQSLK